MNTPVSSDVTDWPVIEAESDRFYSVEILAELSGVPPEMILRYHEEGLIHAVDDGEAGAPGFDDEAVRLLRRLEEARELWGVNEAGLRVLARLLDEVDFLRAALRGRS